MTAVLFHGGRIHVGDGGSADALLARNGRVAAVGRVSDLAGEAGRAERVDLHGGLMVPGWGDAHVHFVWWAMQQRRVDVSDTTSVAEALERVASHARALPADRWILGGRFDKNRWGGWPSARELDRVSHGHPAALSGFKSKEFGNAGYNQLVLDDTDQQRNVEQALQPILDGLHCGFMRGDMVF